MNNERRLENISWLIWEKPYNELTETEKVAVLQGWENPFRARNELFVRKLRHGEKIILR